MTYPDTDLGLNIGYLRSHMRWSQRELAERMTEAGVHANCSTISRLELGNRDPRLRELRVLSQIFMLEPTALLNPHEQFLEEVADLALAGAELREAHRQLHVYRQKYERARSNLATTIRRYGHNSLLLSTEWQNVSRLVTRPETEKE